ncbi:FAS1-like dehydratase domain-containing protein [Qipengyuania sediminis]|uniref:FAS1-like dehydratase domain-containing protein n=1 Tax=Qipengyuania sediminis TaxID=1532023 RepID=UPI00105A5419|nr:MaoC family dehydratase N-terminal domain-containing protein [Qipengyuania sediminis]
MSEWDAWIGREERREDRLDAALAARFCATFDLGRADRVMPQGIHFCLCTPQAPTAALGEDGHPRRGEGGAGLLPPIPLPRRMWAGSAIAFHAPISVGDTVERISRVAAIRHKQGSSGSLVFVEIDHATRAGARLAVEERQTLVFREAAAPDTPLAPPEPGPASFDVAAWDAHRTLTPDPRLLFRYSALTFNSHRIHYDAPYARAIERYRGLVVHGPLIASLLLQLAARQFGDNRLARFAFRGLSPAIAGETLHLVMRGAGDALEMAAFAEDGRQVCGAEGELA